MGKYFTLYSLDKFCSLLNIFPISFLLPNENYLCEIRLVLRIFPFYWNCWKNTLQKCLSIWECQQLESSGIELESHQTTFSGFTMSKFNNSFVSITSTKKKKKENITLNYFLGYIVFKEKNVDWQLHAKVLSARYYS